MTVGDHINIHGSIISYNIVKDKIKFKYTWVPKNDQNVLYALSSNYLSDKRRGKIRLTDKVYLPTIVTGRVLWHLGSTTEASAAAFIQSYQEFQRAALQQEPTCRVRG